MARGAGCETDTTPARARGRSGASSGHSKGCALCGYRWPKPGKFHRSVTPKGRWCDGTQLLDKLPDEYLKAQRSEEREKVMAGVQEMLTSDGWKAWIETRARFHGYSFTNTLLIWMQLRDRARQLGEDPNKAYPSYVSGFKGWKEIGRSVKKGEHGLWIYLPIERRVTETDSVTGEEETQRSVRFIMRPAVFDMSQTEGEPLPEHPYQPLTGDSHAHWLYSAEGALDGPLVQAAAKIGYTVVDEEMINPGTGGYCNPEEKKIALNKDGEPNQKVRTAVHEIAHALGVDYKEYTREQAEVIVETAATIVCRKLGLDTSASSIPYIASWSQKGDWEAIREFGNTIDRVTGEIETALGLDDGAMKAERLAQIQAAEVAADVPVAA